MKKLSVLKKLFFKKFFVHLNNQVLLFYNESFNHGNNHPHDEQNYWRKKYQKPTIRIQRKL